MTHYEIINPSDKVIIASEDDLTAAVAVLLLGEGRYGLCRADPAGKQVLPILLFGGVDDWIKQHGIHDLDTWLNNHALDLAVVFESVFYGSLNELEALESAIGNLAEPSRREARNNYNDKKRASMNNIGARCIAWAKRCRELACNRKSDT